MATNRRSFRSIMGNCLQTTKNFNSKKMFRPIDRELMRVDLEQEKLKDTYRILEEHKDISDLTFANQLFVYKSELQREQKEEGRALKDDYRSYMLDMKRPAAKLEMKSKAPKHLVRHSKFIKI